MKVCIGWKSATKQKLLNNEVAGSLLKEANELVSIFVATVKTVKLKNPKKS